MTQRDCIIEAWIRLGASRESAIQIANESDRAMPHALRALQKEIPEEHVEPLIEYWLSLCRDLPRLKKLAAEDAAECRKQQKAN